MQLAKPRLQIGDSISGGLDHHLLLAVLLDLALPAIDRGHEWKDVHARRETLVDERARDGSGVRIGAERGEDDRNGRGRRRRHSFFLVLFDRECYLGVVLVIKTRYSATTPTTSAP